MLLKSDTEGKDPLTGKKQVRFNISGDEEDSIIVDPTMRDLQLDKKRAFSL